MTDIFIKSFNRPHYLDRCLASITQLVSGNYRVTVLDDGTPQKYLDKILDRYPQVLLKKSEHFEQKNKAIVENLRTGKHIDGFTIPVKLWTDAVKNGSEYFIMTEEDVWFTEKINVDELADLCRKNQIGLLKLGWLGNFSDDKDLIISDIDAKTQTVQPKNLILKSEKFMEAFFLNRYKLFTMLYKLGLVDNVTQRKYWALNSILMGLYDKKYWLKIWDKMAGKVDEKRQLINAAVHYKANKNNPAFISRLKKEAMRTTFQSSATNSYHEYGNSFDVNIFNHLLNEAWYSGGLDPMENFPEDFSEKYIKSFLGTNEKTLDWQPWADKFREQYRNLGCKVD